MMTCQCSLHIQKKKKKQATIKCVDIAGIIGLPYVPSKSDVALYTNLTTYL